MNARSILLPVFVTLAALAAAGPAGEQPAPEFVRQIDLIHFSHTDYGFTDHPAVCRDMQRRYLDIAVDAALATQAAPEESRFRWTAETTVAVDDWWQPPVRSGGSSSWRPSGPASSRSRRCR